jgi:hypothetical protein
MSCRDARGQAPVQEELGPDIGRAFSVRGFHWERGKRARTAVVWAAAYLPAALEARTEGWGKAAATAPSIAWIETRYGNVLGRPGRDRRTPAALAFFQCDRRRGTQPGRPGRDDRAADRSAVAAAPTKNQAAYEHSLGLLPGRPQVVITDSDNAIGGAVATEGDQVTIVRNGAIVSRDRHAFLAEVEDTYGEDVADEVMLAMLPIDERLHVEQHRNREITKRMRELEDED